MMKQLKRVIFAVMVVIFMPSVVMAAGLSCDSQESYRIVKSGTNTISFGGSETYNLNFYDTKGAGSNAKTFCLDPGRKGPSGTTYVCDRMIDPTGVTSGVGSKQHALDVAVSKAYYELVKKGYDRSDEFSRSVGEIVFRWLFFNYNLGDTESTMGALGNRYVSYFKPVYGGGINPIWNNVSGGNGEIVAAANTIYQMSVAAGNRVYQGEGVGGSATYTDLVNDGTLPNEKFEYTVTTSEDASMAGRKIYTVQFTGTPSGEVWWDDFKVGSDSQNIRIERTENVGGGTFRIYVNEQGFTGAYNLYIDTVYYMETSAMTSMKILKSTVNGLQRMLVAVDQGDSGAAHALIKGGNRIPLTTERCTDDKTRVCTYDENNVPIECRPAEPGECPNPPSERKCKSENGVYYGINGNIVTALQFFEECCENDEITQEEKDKYCPCGEPDIDFVGDCSDFNSDVEVVNKIGDTQDDARLRTCLFNNASTDIAGNTLKMTDQSTVSGNPYCKVSCIEEYKFNLPNAQYTNSGSYFKLSSSISGERKCYVNAADDEIYNGIDHQKFINDLYEASKALAEAQSIYNEKKAALSQSIKVDNGHHDCGGGPVYKIQKFQYNKCEVTKNGDQISVNCSSTEHKGYQSGAFGYYGDEGEGCKSHGSSGSEEKLKKAILGGTSLDGYASAVTSAQASITKIFERYKQCTTWDNNFVFDPVTEFTYSQPYESMPGFNGTFAKVSSGDSSKTNYCSSDVGDTYQCSGTSDSNYSQSYVSCSGDSCTTAYENVSSTIYMIKTKNVSAVYQPKNEFSVYTPLGTIAINKKNNLYTLLCKDEKNCLPISMNTKTGVYNFDLTFTNVGQYNDSNSLGRLMGGFNSVLDGKSIESNYICHYIVNIDDRKRECKYKDGLDKPGYWCEYDKDNNEISCDKLPDPVKCPIPSTENKEGCWYKDGLDKPGSWCEFDKNGNAINCNLDPVKCPVDCPNCTFTCVGDKCGINPNPDCPDCPYVCQNCIFDGSENTYYYRTVSINNLFPNSRRYGPNWNNDKGDYTRKVVESSGDSVYKEPEYSYTITANQMARIREYNKSVSGYINPTMPNGSDALTCYDKDGYENVYCISNFLETPGTTYFTENKRNDQWTLWPNSGYYNSNTKYSVIDGIGPAWK